VRAELEVVAMSVDVDVDEVRKVFEHVRHHAELIARLGRSTSSTQAAR
jgi:tetrahydromethanopterin S-methyltransferase subunit F